MPLQCQTFVISLTQPWQQQTLHFLNLLTKLIAALLAGKCYCLSSSSFRQKYNNFGYLSIQIWLKGNDNRLRLVNFKFCQSQRKTFVIVIIFFHTYRITFVHVKIWSYSFGHFYSAMGINLSKISTRPGFQKEN